MYSLLSGRQAHERYRFVESQRRWEQLAVSIGARYYLAILLQPVREDPATQAHSQRGQQTMREETATQAHSQRGRLPATREEPARQAHSQRGRPPWLADHFRER